MQGYDDWTQEERDAIDAIAAEDGLTGRELWERIKPTAEEERFHREYAQAHPEYVKAVQHFAALCNVTPERFERERRAHSEVLHPTSECLTIDEIESLASGAPLSDPRQQHVDTCKFCTGLLDAMNAPIDLERQRQFVDEVVKSAQQQRKS